MESQGLPPSYSEVFPSQPPTAPSMSGNSPAHNSQPVPGWNPNMNHQYPQHPVTAQPMINQPQVIHQQFRPPQHQTVVIINQHLQLGDQPVSLICPHCKLQSITKLHYETGWVTHSAAGLLCILGWCPCAIIPYLTDCLKDTRHNCAKCNGFIGMYRRSNQSRF